jgi:hypothetical protein
MRHFLATCSGLALCLFMSAGVTSAASGAHPGLPAWPVGNQGEGHGNGHGDHGRGHYEKEGARVAFSAHDREIIRSYFREYPSELPPGLVKRGGDLPHGLEKHLRENGTLPPGLEKRLRPCPVGLSRRLPPLPQGYSRMMLGARLLILDRANVIVDIMFVTR